MNKQFSSIVLLGLFIILILSTFVNLPAGKHFLFLEHISHHYGMLKFLAFIFCLFGLFGLFKQPATVKNEALKIYTHHTYDPLLTLRAMACLMVIIGHGYVCFFYPGAALLQRGAWLLVASPWTGVWVFFTLSGYLMGKGFYSRRYQPDFTGIKSFFRNRILRIVPLYWVSVIIISLVFFPAIFSSPQFWNLIHLVMFNYHGEYLKTDYIILWSITTEVSFYLLVPFIFILIGNLSLKYHKMLALGMSVILFAGLFYRIWVWKKIGGYEIWFTYAYVPLIGNLDLFLTGFLLNPVVIGLKQKFKNLTLSNVMGILGMILLYYLSSYMSLRSIMGNPRWTVQFNTIFPTVACILTATIIGVFELSQPIQMEKIPGIKSIIRYTQIIGILTYGIYIWHWPIYMLLAKIFPVSHSLSHSILNIAMGFPVVFLIALFTYYFIEVPFERKKQTSLSSSGMETTVSGSSKLTNDGKALS